MAKKSVEPSRKFTTIRVKLGDRATIIDPDDENRKYLPGSTATLAADWQGTPLTQHWRRALAQGSCAVVDSKTTASEGSA